VLEALSSKVNQPTTNWFLTSYLSCLKFSVAHLSAKQRYSIECLARYVAELALLECKIASVYLPSQMAASALFLAMFTLTGKAWPEQDIAQLTGYNLSSGKDGLKSCVTEMFAVYKWARVMRQQAIQEKFTQDKFEKIALVDPPNSLPF
jgi:hypothetical protein